MGAREDMLKTLLGARLAGAPPPLPRPADFVRAGLADQVAAVYRALGGLLDEPPGERLGPWDLALASTAVELDEALHFNRWRAVTLEAPIYGALPRFPRRKYRDFCESGEAEALKAGSSGGRWTTPSAERQFGPSAPPGQLAGPGAARWRQRAFYDFLKDLAPLACGVAMTRIAIWDRVAFAHVSMTLGYALDTGQASAASAMARLIESRRPLEMSGSV
ncbi:hypothetical protein [uncultured Albimonas sp.]|uniref:DUF7255 family protein n=1 Tax=uncultured Albimonas sp. TaxID=1331701 RepID=UPI0030EBC56A|tara:strand:- start:2432 stop:3088 length:657 start_codon:yes stop_codon:yes gene_type:complete